MGVSLFVTWVAVTYDGLPLGSIGISMLCGGLAGGWLYRWRPKLAQHPLTGFCLTLTVSSLRSGLMFAYALHPRAALPTFGPIWMTPVLQGAGTALILAIVGQVREHDAQARAAVSAELCALQARMNPHFLFNALNALASLATLAPREIPRAVGRLRHFLRASFDQHERVLVSLEEELAVVHAYLDIESLRFGSRLKVEERIEPGLAGALTPPFSLQPLVENAVHHGLQSSPKAGRLCLEVPLVGHSLEMSVSDDGATEPRGSLCARDHRGQRDQFGGIARGFHPSVIWHRIKLMWIRIRAVIVEDEPLATAYLAALLDETCQVEVVGTAPESEAGLRLCAELRPDVAFIDINLPGKDGVSLATQLALLPQPPRWKLSSRKNRAAR